MSKQLKTYKPLLIHLLLTISIAMCLISCRSVKKSFKEKEIKQQDSIATTVKYIHKDTIIFVPSEVNYIKSPPIEITEKPIYNFKERSTLKLYKNKQGDIVAECKVEELEQRITLLEVERETFIKQVREEKITIKELTKKVSYLMNWIIGLLAMLVIVVIVAVSFYSRIRKLSMI